MDIIQIWDAWIRKIGSASLDDTSQHNSRNAGYTHKYINPDYKKAKTELRIVQRTRGRANISTHISRIKQARRLIKKNNMGRKKKAN